MFNSFWTFWERLKRKTKKENGRAAPADWKLNVSEPDLTAEWSEC